MLRMDDETIEVPIKEARGSAISACVMTNLGEISLTNAFTFLFVTVIGVRYQSDE